VEPIQIIDEALFDEVAARALAAPRQRMNHNFHATAEDNPHRFLNVLLQNTYIRPHRHLNPPKSEAFLVLEGVAEVIVFTAEGDITARYRLGEAINGRKRWGVDLAPGVWHTVIAISPRAVCYEVKPGPWEPASDKEFAAWAPAEGDPKVPEFLQLLKSC
jgi:cupin fold WbuC family metalloprotein